MMKADRMRIELELLVPAGAARPIADGMTIEELTEAVRAAGGTMGRMRMISTEAVEGDDAAIQVAQSGADIAPFVDGRETFEVLRVVRPTGVIQPEEHYATVPIVSAEPTDAGWIGRWGFSGGAITATPDGHPTREDALTDATRRAMASIDPEAEADEFDEQAHVDAFDLAIRYGVMFIDDENRWRGRWYRGEWTGEGAYTEALYDTPGQARRAAYRLRATGDES
jgi:hypothetical protein